MASPYADFLGSSSDHEHSTPWLDEEESWLDRFLKEKKKDEGRMDYSVLSVAVMTLGLILVVEVIRHRLDHAAMGRPYFTAVLENIYAELSTLGIVEFFVFLLQRYHTSMNKAKKDVFGDVHFALFYTAILNAFQSIILAFITTRVSDRLWVQTEALELDHYVEVREEFERVQALLNETSESKKKSEGSDVTASDLEDEQQQQRKSLKYHGEYVFEASWKGIQSLWYGFVDAARRPRLMHQYNTLLMQVRFHELRVHFLQSYDLPAKLKVSDYLIRCQLAVLIKLVHVSAVAWLLLTASANLLYFILGVVGYFEESPEVVGVSLIWIFFCSMSLFIVLALLVFNKMKSIFRDIMHREELWEVVDDENRQRELAKQQMNMFWGGSPKLVIAALQFMQFGYAVALSVVLMFWNTINDGNVANGWYFLAIGICYSSFVAVAANVIPRYTLCTSLAQLVDKKRLNETVAHFHLDEAKRHRDAGAHMHTYNHNTHPLKADSPKMGTNHTFDSSGASLSSGNESSHHSGATTIADLVSMDTASLREAVPVDENSDKVSERQLRKEQRKRMRSISDGVAIMASIRDEDAEEEKTEVDDDAKSSHSEPRVRKKSASDGVAEMALGAETPRRGIDRLASERIASLVSMDTKSLREQLSKHELGRLEEKGSGRTKSKSDPSKMEKMSQKPREKQRSGDGVKFMAGLATTLGFRPTVKTEKDQNEDVDDNLSDMGDVPEVDYGHLKEFRKAELERERRATFKERCNKYFTSKRFPVVSNVFGTMVAFFLIGGRVERFLHTEDIVPRDFISFDLHQSATFAILSGWFFFFVVMDGLVFYSVDGKSTTRSHRVVRLASLMDAVIVGVCWTVFWVAEIKRCCGDADNTVPPDDDYGPHPCDCPTFGSRLYGGLGTIEPWTSLIALRLFRFYVAKKLIARDNRKKGITATAEEVKADIEDEQNLDPFNVHDGHGHGHGHDDHGGHGGHGGHDDHDHGHGEPRGTAAELWEHVLGEHPDLVEKYGMFSAEVLQTMLGLPLSPSHHEAPHEIQRVESDIGSEPPPEGEPRELDMNATYLLDPKYALLSPGAQEIIMQGKLGRSVNAVSNFDSVGTIPEDDSPRQRGSAYAFKISEDDSVAASIHFDQQLPFDEPDAPLVRSMRRCDRKFVPILNKWSTVDVVMTRFEMVYFDAVDISDGPETDAPFQAVKATKGGKGLRLKDVAVGRKVVGHLRISDITSLAVERYPPSDETGEEEGPDDVVAETEFWMQETLHFSRKEAWHKTNQDTLAVHTSHNQTLYLRFYSDLDDSEGWAHDESKDSFKNNAFQWIKTLGRFCTPERLHQSLPHFGDNNDDELRDYLVVHEQGELRKNLMFLANHGNHMRHNETVADTSNRTAHRSSSHARSSQRFSFIRSSQSHGLGDGTEKNEDNDTDESAV